MDKSRIELFNIDETAVIDRESLLKKDQRHPYLVIYIGNDSGHRHKLRRGTMTIGRSPQADITIEDDRISRIHCIMEWMPARFRIGLALCAAALLGLGLAWGRDRAGPRGDEDSAGRPSP